MINLKKSSIEFFYVDSVSVKYKIKNKNKLHYFKKDNDTICVNPFINKENDSMFFKKLVDYIKEKYDYKKSKERVNYGASEESMHIAIQIDKNGNLFCFGRMYESNSIEFEKEILEILNLIDDKLFFPVFENTNKKYSYLKTFRLTNYDLYE